MKKLLTFIVVSCKNKWWKGLVFILSPTLLFAAFTKENKKCKDDVREFIISQNWRYFIISPLVALLVWIAAVFEFTGFIIIGGLYSISRINEIFYAFINDATSEVDPDFRTAL